MKLIPLFTTIFLFVVCGLVEQSFQGYGLLVALVLTWPNAILAAYLWSD